MRALSAFVSVCLATALAACASFESKQAAFLDAAQGRASHEDIRLRLGEPTNRRSLDGGQSLWIYEKREQQSGSRYAAPGMWCKEYALTFDERGILQHWTRRSYFHGGELMPRQCIPD
jgi:outer membrane protein assembly factor BamE (lipoprotein component of BamABCDE complex)